MQRAEEDTRKRVHPTQKPVALFNWFSQRWIKPGDTVGDMFAGSGVTLIGCEHAVAECRASEIDPAYCDVIVERWQNLTGGKATRA